MRHRLSVRVLVAVALGVVAASAQAQPGPWPGPGYDPGLGEGPGQGRGMPPPGRHEGLARDLSLSEAQQEKVRGIMDQQRTQREALYDKISANRDALHQLLESGGADANAVGELVLQGRKLHEEGRALREAEQKAIRAILTPEQQKKFDQVLEQRRDRGPGRGPGGFQGRPPGGPGTTQPRPPLGPSQPGQLPGQP